MKTIETSIRVLADFVPTSREGLNSLDSDLEGVRRRLRRVNESRDNRLKVFGPWVPQALKEIERNRERFSHRPIGPLGELRELSYVYYNVS